MNKQSNFTAVASGIHTRIPLNQLIKSPRNVRKVPHSKDAIEAYAASIAAKGILQNLVVEPEFDEAKAATGRFFVTIGEGRRLAQCLRVERGEITDDELIPCVIDTVNDPHEISLDENVTREAMHPADQFDAFKKLNDDGMGAEDIAARFGVNDRIVKQRLRLAAASPRLMEAYRADQLTLDQLMAFCLTADHVRQEAVFDRLTSWQREPHQIRRMMTETSIRGDDRRARFVGSEAYMAAGGKITRDLFTDDDDGYFEDGALLEKLAVEALTVIAIEVQEAEGWKWAEGAIDFPYHAGMRRAFEKTVALSDEDETALKTAKAALLALSEEYEECDELPGEVDARMTVLEEEIDRLRTLGMAYSPDDISIGGVIVSLTHDGRYKVERGLIRAEEWEARQDAERRSGTDDDNNDDDDQNDAPASKKAGGARLPDTLIRDLTAHHTLALRLALGEQPELAGRALAHLLVLDTFFGERDLSCLDIRPVRYDLAGWLDDYAQSSAVEALQVRHNAWAERLPKPDALWSYLLAMEPEDLGLLIAHCVALTINVVRQPHVARPAEGFTAELSSSLGLDISAHWRPTARTYFSRVAKENILSAVREAESEEAADRISKLKKTQMAEAAEQLIAPTGWMPPLLRVAPVDWQPWTADDLAEAAE